MRWFNQSLWILLALTPLAQAGDIYVCEKNGKKEFSQLPCGDNATVMKDKTEPSSIQITNPMKEKDITRLCQLVIQAKDRYAVAQTAPSYSRRSYGNDSYRYRSSDYHSNNSNSNTPKAYVLSHITNLEQLAAQSPRIYELVKGLTDRVYYQGYDQSPIYQAERAAAQTNCEDEVAQRLYYLQRND